jgi:hypothetical protein
VQIKRARRQVIACARHADFARQSRFARFANNPQSIVEIDCGFG